MAFTGVPENLRTTLTNDTSFTGAWDALTDAVSYQVDVSTSATFTVVAPAVAGGESFTSLNASGTSYSTNSYVGDNGLTWEYGQARKITTTYTIDGTTIGFAETGTRYARTTATGGVDAVTYKVRSYYTGGGAADRTIELWVAGTQHDTFTLPAMDTVYTQTVANINEGGSVQVEFRSTGTRHIALDTVSWTGYVGTAPNYVAGYEQRGVASPGLTVTGLVADTTYHWRVRGVDAGSDVSGYSATQSVTTVTNDLSLLSLGGETESISSLVNDAAVTTVSDGVEAWRVAVTNPAGNLRDATVSALRITQASGNMLTDWSRVIGAAGLFDGSTLLGSAAISPQHIAVTGISGLTVADGAQKELSLRVALVSTNVLTDHAHLAFALLGTNVTMTGNAITTDRIDSDAGSNRIDVAATHLRFSLLPPITVTVMGNFPVSVRAEDIHGNLDVDEGAVDVSIAHAAGAGTLLNGTARTLDTGTQTWPTLRVSTSGVHQVSATDGPAGLVDSSAWAFEAVDGRVTNLFQGFESSPYDTWPITSGGGLATNVPGASDTPANGRIRSGGYSWQAAGDTSTLILEDTPIEGFNSHLLRVHISSTATTAAQGADASDSVQVYAALNGDAFRAVPEVIIKGYNDAKWNYDSGRVLAATVGESVSGTNYSIAAITIPDGARSIALKVVARSGLPAERWNVDDISLGSDPGEGYDSDPPVVYELTLQGHSAPRTGGAAPWINEIDYDNPSTDSNEWVELVGEAGLSLDEWELVFINSLGSEYATEDLADAGWTFTDESDGHGFFVIGKVNPTDGTADYTPAGWTQNEIQNAGTQPIDADSVAVRRKESQDAAHLLDYDGNNIFTEEDQATTDADSDVASSSLYLTGGPGLGFDDFTWDNATGNATPGSLNAGQSLARPGTALVTLTDAQFADGGYAVTCTVQDVWSGLVITNEAGYGPRPYYVVLNDEGNVAVSNTFTSAASNGVWRSVSFSALAAPAATDVVQLGTGQVYCVVTQYQTNQLSVTSAPLPFVVMDDDAEGPELADFTFDGNTYSCASIGDGVVVSGRVRDAGSGLYGVGASDPDRAPHLTLLRPNGSTALPATLFSSTPAQGEGQDWSPMSYTIDPMFLTVMGTYTVRVCVTDYDRDRLADHVTTTNTFTFTSTIDVNADDDGDGVNNGQEFLAGTDATDSNAYLRLVSVEPSGEQGLVFGLWVGTGSGRLYSVLGANALADPKTPLSGTPPAGGLDGVRYWTNTTALAANDTRFFACAVSAGGNGYTNTEEWAAYRQPRRPGESFLVSVPIDYGSDASNSLNGKLGACLALGLHADTDVDKADRIQYIDAAGAWRECLLIDATPAPAYWYDVDLMEASTLLVKPGDAFWVIRGTGATARASTVFSGRPYTESTAMNITFKTNYGGWTVFGWPLPRPRTHASSESTLNQLGFSTPGTGGKASTTDPALTGDQLLVWGDGRWVGYHSLLDHVGPGWDGRWWDNLQRRLADISLEPGKAYYYRHTTNWGGTNFTWKPANP